MAKPDIKYDREGDVLYVTYRRDAAHKGTVTGNGMIKRYDAADELIGITIVDFAERLKSGAYQ